MRRRGYRGWIAASTVAGLLTLTFMAVEKQVRQQRPQRASDAEPAWGTAVLPSTHKPAGILLSVDPGLAGTIDYPSADQTDVERVEDAEQTEHDVRELMRRPPEPAANVVLQAPVATTGWSELPLEASQSGIDYLMSAMNDALEKPIHVASSQVLHTRPPEPQLAMRERFGNARPTAPPASTASRVPQPTQLLQELTDLQQRVDPRLAGTGSMPNYVSHLGAPDAATTRAASRLAVEAQEAIHELVVRHGLEHPQTTNDLQHLDALALSAYELGKQTSDYGLAAELMRVGYAIQRRVAVWRAVQASLDDTSIELSGAQRSLQVKDGLLRSLANVEDLLGTQGDADAWRAFLELDALAAWAQESESQWQTNPPAVSTTLARLHWPELTERQSQFLARTEFAELAAHLVVWGRDAVDYRTFLTDLEEFESDPITRQRTQLAASVQVLRLASDERAQAVAATVDGHYRNANIRLSISNAFLNRFLPEADYQIRPVRQNILGADTRGRSAVHTQLQLQMVPDPNAWNVGLSVLGDLESQTRASKGPAVFHNSSQAKIASTRYIRVNQDGYHVSGQPTRVDSRDFLRSMSTDYDGFPVIGDFVRLIVREQFDQKKGLAQRISRRIIAREADQEFDRRLAEGLRQAEIELQDRLVGPLEQLNLNPSVVSMQTTSDRISVRYRVANESQLAAHTPRPRAPSDSLLSMQLNQSSINNAIDQLGLSGKTWTLPELYQRLADVFQRPDWQVPQDLPQDITIRFADTRPATVEMKDGKLRLTLRIARLHSQALDIERFIVSSSYIPVAENLSAELVRDGVVEIISQRDRLPLRLIFAKVFVSRPEIPLISPQWQADPRAEGLAVSQLDIRDGWLAVAISPETSQQAAAVAERRRELLR